LDPPGHTILRRVHRQLTNDDSIVAAPLIQDSGPYLRVALVTGERGADPVLGEKRVTALFIETERLLDQMRRDFYPFERLRENLLNFR
jgi:hypothetical protein